MGELSPAGALRSSIRLLQMQPPRRRHVFDGGKLQAQIQTLAKDPSKQQELQSLVQGFQALLDGILQSGSADAQTLGRVAGMYLSMADALDSSEVTRSAAAGLYAKAEKAYQDLIAKLEQADSSRARAYQIRLAHALRKQKKFRQAINTLLKVLSQQTALLEAQREAAYTFQEWAQENPRYYRYAIRGYTSRRTGKHLVWGWGRMANVLQRYEKFRSLFHEARFNLTLCVYQQALAAQGEDAASQKLRLLKAAKQGLWLTYRQYPKLGGPLWRAKYDQLLRRIQRELGEPAVGLQAFEQRQQEEKQKAAVTQR